MTPRQADVAFVLESLEGIRALYGIKRGSPAAANFDFALEHDDLGGRLLAVVHYALLRVLTHDECARVHFFHTTPPRVIAESAEPLFLTDSEREAARQHVPPPSPRPPLVVYSGPPTTTILIVDDDPSTEALVRQLLDGRSSWETIPNVEAAARRVRHKPFALILCDAERAFGLDGLLAKLPLAVARHVLVMVAPPSYGDALRLLQGSARLLKKPLDTLRLREHMALAGATTLLPVQARGRRRRVERPPSSAPFTALLVDLEEEVHDALRSVFPEDARHLLRRDPEDAAEVALSQPLHVVLCSAKAALHPRSFLDAVAREDPSGADLALVVAPSRDVPYVEHKLAQKGRTNRVLALPLDDVALREEIYRAHPSLVARVAASELATAKPFFPERVRFRRLGLLVVDDNPTTEILFAAGAPRDDADIALATTPMKAFEHVTSRAVDGLVISATMRGDGGEPVYRVLWRLKPELKSKTVLVAAAGAIPPSLALPARERIVERPLTREAIARISRTFAHRTGAG